MKLSWGRIVKTNLRTRIRNKGLWTISRKKDSYYHHLHEDYINESKYINSLSDDEKEWLNDFLLGYYHRNKQAMDRLKFPLELRRSRYNQHRGVINDVYTKAKEYCYIEDFEHTDNKQKKRERKD